MEPALSAEAAFTLCRVTLAKLIYMRGLRPEIRSWIEGTGATADKSLEVIMEAAVKADAAVLAKVSAGAFQGSKPKIAAMDVEVGEASGFSAISAEIAAIRQQVNNAMGGKKTGGGGKKNGAKPAAGTGWLAKQRALPKNQRDWIECVACWGWGQHFASECTMSHSERGTKKRGCNGPKPAGPARDAMFPN